MSALAGAPFALELRDLSIAFATPEGSVPAVRGASLSVSEGERVGIVGESGSGKSTLLLAVMGLLDESAMIRGGPILYRGSDLAVLDDEGRRRLRGREMAMVFQDPLTSLHPLHTVGGQIEEAIRSHRDVSKGDAHQLAVEALADVGIPQASSRAKQYPHELSGGMRQRVMIAMALALRPRLILADEPTTALDVTVQAQILDLLERVRAEIHAAIVLVTHDLAVIAQRTDRTIVMYAGTIVEEGSTVEVFRRPRHPYTAALLESVLRHDVPTAEELPYIPGAPPTFPPEDACPFVPRCRYAADICSVSAPELRAIEAKHRAACHFAEALAEREVVG
jgi:oligopeptide transport system ATP-binding protein